MNTSRLLRTYSAFRNFMARFFSREFLIFLFFLALSALFWLLMTLNDTYEKEIAVELRVVNVPRNVVITNDVADTVRFTVRDKGYMIGSYLYSQHLRPLRVNFQQYADGKGHAVIPVGDIQRLIYQQLYNSSKIVSVKSDAVEFFYNFGQHKKVPIRLYGRVEPGENYYLAHVQFSPDSVTVYAGQPLLDSIKFVNTIAQNISNFTKMKTVRVGLRRIRGAKFEPKAVEMKLFPDILTEETVEVPIYPVNVPEDKVLRVFPPKVEVKFVIGANQLRTMPKDRVTKALLPKGFRAVVDYNEIADHPSDKCHVFLEASPSFARHARPVVNTVDYLIETK